MKKLLSFSILLMLCVSVMAQTVTLTFTGRDAASQYVQLDRVTVTDQTKGWTETLLWPDTTLTMQNGTGIADYAHNAGFALSQNNPNPFNGTTDVNLTVADAGTVTLEIADMNGRVVVGANDYSPVPGRHQFRVSLSAAGTYMMTARQNGKMSSIKMVNNGGGKDDGIEYVGIVRANDYLSQQPKSHTRGSTANPFNFGDQMEYVGYATINGVEYESERITQAQGASQTFRLQFPVTQVQTQTPIVSTSPVSGISSTSAIVGGNVVSDGGFAVFDRGICWNSTGTPTLNDNCLHVGNGTGEFSDNLTGLSAGTTYYVRAYAINSEGIGYGNESVFTTLAQLPTVTTAEVSTISATSATCGGEVTYDGGGTVTARGVCWSTSQDPTIADSHTTDGSGIGVFNSSITGLVPAITYYVRAYATNNAGTAYGEEVSFSTETDISQDGQPCPSMPILTDIDGNFYNTVQIGNQCWMRENLRTMKYADGISISQGSHTSTEDAYWYYPNNISSNKLTYGLLYNWAAVMRYSSSSNANPSGVQGICPTGWHVPSHLEWNQLTDYVRSQSQYHCNSTAGAIAKALAGTTGWNISTTTCAVGNMPSANNSTGFSALPAGRYFGNYDYFGADALFWSATGSGTNASYYRSLYYTSASVISSTEAKYCGISVRCLRDEGGSSTSQIPTVTTTVASNITATSASCGGNVTSDGGDIVTARGVCWSTAHNPTIGDNYTNDGSGTGSFTSSIMRLTPNTTYYVRAYAANSAGTAYGEEVSLSTETEISQDGQPCPGTPTLTDVDGNVYNTVQIGSQCWMKENLRTTHYADNTEIPAYNGEDYLYAPYWYVPNNDEENVSTYGLLYNWIAVMSNSSTSSSNPSGVQGICPTGWHVPSDAEWTQLTDYVSSQSQYVCGSDNTYIAKALAGTTGWNVYNNTCAVGNTPYGNNATGFSALPAGRNSGSIFGNYAIFWSATESGVGGNVYIWELYYLNADVTRRSTGKIFGYSVRCVKD